MDHQIQDSIHKAITGGGFWVAFDNPTHFTCIFFLEVKNVFGREL